MQNSSLSRGKNVSIELETEQAPYRYHGTFVSMDDSFVTIRGTVGDTIDKIIYIPLRMIKSIQA